MSNKNEMIFINKILNTELTIRKTAKQFGLRRDDLIRRMQEILAGDEENLKQLDLVIIINKMLFDNIPMCEVAKELGISEKELDKKILSTLENNPDKLQRYNDYKNPKEKKVQKKTNLQNKKYGKQNSKNKPFIKNKQDNNFKNKKSQ